MSALGLLQPILGGLLTAAILAWLARAMSRSRSAVDADGTQRIMLHRGLLAGLILGSTALSGAAFYGATGHNGGPAAWGVAIVFGLVALGTLGSFSRAYDVNWTATSVTGPASYGMAPFGPRRAHIRFNEIAELGIDAMGSFYVRTAEGEKVRWNWVYQGHEDLNAAIESARPDLFDEPPPAP